MQHLDRYHSACFQLTLICIISDSSVSPLISTRECDKVARSGRATARDIKLVAAGVELGPGVRIGSVEGDDFVAHEVITGLEARWDGVLHTSVAADHQGGLFTLGELGDPTVCCWRMEALKGSTHVAPGIRCAVTAGFRDLEPYGTVLYKTSRQFALGNTVSLH